MTKYDKALIVVLVILSAYLFSNHFFDKNATNNNNKFVIIEHNHELIKKIQLNNPSYNDTITIETDYTQVVEINGSKVRMKESNCKNQVCVDTGWIDSTNQSIVCIPAKVVIKISGDNTDIDTSTF